MQDRNRQGIQSFEAAVLVDVDGTLAGPYRNGRRELRPSAAAVLELLSLHAAVFLWSIVGADNGTRLLEEYPELKRCVEGCLKKDVSELWRFKRPVCIDDDDVDEAVRACDRVILGESYDGGAESDVLMRAAVAVIDLLANGGSA